MDTSVETMIAELVQELIRAFGSDVTIRCTTTEPPFVGFVIRPTH